MHIVFATAEVGSAPAAMPAAARSKILCAGVLPALRLGPVKTLQIMVCSSRIFYFALRSPFGQRAATGTAIAVALVTGPQCTAEAGAGRGNIVGDSREFVPGADVDSGDAVGLDASGVAAVPGACGAT
jgi:hypothetical protein